LALQIVVPMAGEGQRFRDAGYTIPKPLIPVAGKPMVVRAVQDLPEAQRVVFIVRQDHIDQHHIDQELRTHFPNCCIVPVEGITEGQACTTRLAADAMEADWPVIVAACDNTHLYDREKLQSRMDDPAVECLIWTYRGDPRVDTNPQQYGWVRESDERVTEVSCKQPISDTPRNDHAVSGCFSFRCAGRMMEYIDKMVDEDVRINGEFYLDVVPNIAIGLGRHVEVFEVEKYIGWGTPEDLEAFHK
jgi:dTDP-glucose pyrophosphorylase